MTRRIAPRLALTWVLLAAALGFSVAFLFSGLFGLSRPAFVLPYAAVALLVAAGFTRHARLRWADELRRRWARGLVVAALAAAFLVWSVLRQPASAAPTGGALAAALVWEGVVYGLADATLLVVVPVLAVFAGFGQRPDDRLRAHVAALAFLASLFVGGVYHMGFAEFRGPRLAAPLLGVGIGALAYLVARNPLAPALSHVAMHVAAVLHGPATTLQLPPHT